MKSQEVAIYRKIQKNTDIAMKALDTMSDKVYDDNLASKISRQALKYSEFHNEATKQLIEAKAEPYHATYFSNIMLKAGIQYNTLLNTSTGHIAELLIRGSNNGIVEMEKVLKHNQNVGEQPVMLAKQLIDFEENNVADLKEYL